ncbi:MAG: ABC-2 family transporter protein [Clostridiales bacterium]|nr:ABC-2 family transporter protein [Clostridiales bacterium]
MKKYLRLYRQSIRISFAAAMSYRANFILQSLIMILSNSLFPLITLLIYKTGASFPGWSLYEVLLLQSIFTISSGFANMLFSGVVWVTMDHVKEGTLEIVLIKPVKCLFYLVATTFSVENVAVVVGGVIVFIIAYSNISAPSLISWLAAIVFFLIGLLVMLALNLLMSATSFKWVANTRIPEMFTSVLNFGNYPSKIFPKSLQAVITFILPVTMVSCFPAEALLGRADGFMFLAILPCILFLIIGICIYEHMVTLYEGVGG